MNLKRVCSSCFGNQDLRGWIREHDGRRGRDFCGKFDSPTIELHKLVPHIDECLHRYYGRAVDQLGYCPAEGGYLGEHWDAWDMLGKMGIDLPPDDGTLFSSVAGAMADEPWCDYDVGHLTSTSDRE